MIRSYSEMMKRETFKERLEYLELGGVVGRETFGGGRYLNQDFYRSHQWKQARQFVITRDYGYDLAVLNQEIFGIVVVHHINPIELKDVKYRTDKLFDPENLITCSSQTHQAIHFGYTHMTQLYEVVERTPNDTKLW